MTDATQLPCLFCKPPRDRIFFRAELVIGLWDAYPVSPGHALLITQRHIPTWFEANAEELDALFRAIDAAKTIIEQNHRPDGYNIGVNCGAAAGQTIFHLHIHLIPRFAGDVADPRGGVRYVIPQNANYLSSTRGSASKQDGPPK
jgi:diadenosine tetraphosphate (Ap4A) HIT family hydrolase